MTSKISALAAALLFITVGFPQYARAEAVSLFRAATFRSETTALVDASQPDQRAVAALGASSLFIGQADGSLFAPYPVRLKSPGGPVQLDAPASAIERLRNLIGVAEAGRLGYDAVQHGARVRPGKSPTAMTVAEIYAWIDQTPGQQHAIGRYQFIPATLKRLIGKLGISGQTVFSQQVQDRLADALLAEAGLNAMTTGKIGRHQFMNNLAKIWAGLPNSSGRSHYDGYAGNRATMTWARFDTEMGNIFPG